MLQAVGVNALHLVMASSVAEALGRIQIILRDSQTHPLRCNRIIEPLFMNMWAKSHKLHELIFLRKTVQQNVRPSPPKLLDHLEKLVSQEEQDHTDLTAASR